MLTNFIWRRRDRREVERFICETKLDADEDERRAGKINCEINLINLASEIVKIEADSISITKLIRYLTLALKLLNSFSPYVFVLMSFII